MFPGFLCYNMAAGFELRLWLFPYFSQLPQMQRLNKPLFVRQFKQRCQNE